MRDDSRPQDAFSWTRPWVPYGDDPFVWHDPAEDFRTPAAANDSQDAPSASVSGPADEENSPMIAPATEGGDDMWVELPALDEKPKKSRARRGRNRGRSDETDVAEAPAAAEEFPDPVAVIEEAAAPLPEPEAETEAPAAPAKRSRARKPKAEAVTLETSVLEAPAAEPAPVEVVTEPGVEAPAEKPARAARAKAPVADPAEISTPPSAPRKGWWRRG